MRAARVVSAALAFGLSASSAGAATEPNGLQVPIDSSPETQLYTLFQTRNETINWQSDGQTTPNQFSPLCGFTATYVMNQAGAHYGLAWYNDTGQPPQPADLHPLVAPGSPVGTTFSGTVIRNDPAYAGGLVGFALIGGETHYSNPAYNHLCSGCNPAAPWITGLIYASTATPNAYYLCFEDGLTSANGWDNDGDFNDDVYFITGVTCSGGGKLCDTGKPGICAAGLTQCAAGASSCKQVVQPAASEICNGLDDDCNGQVDEGNPCASGKVCDKGTCVQSCARTEFPCASGLVCEGGGHCVDPRCAGKTCPTGEVCVAGTCKAPCDGVVCPYPQVCRVGACVDPCAGVTCDTGDVCENGVCVTGCTCQVCAQGKACDTKSGHCVETACVGVACGPGTHCVGGQCIGVCTGAVCPVGQACENGGCVSLPPAPPSANDAGSGLSGPADAGPADAGQADAPSEFGTAPKSGCGCRVADKPSGRALALWMLLGPLAWAVRRRSRSRDHV